MNSNVKITSDSEEISQNNIEEINLIVRQTSYNFGDAKKKYFEMSNNYEEVIKDFYGIKKDKNSEDQKIINLNKSVYTEIRNFLDKK